ncbi:MAG: hypothetical protein ACP5LS_06495, partial [Thermoprotei archaeon]
MSMKENDALAAALLTMLVLVNLAFADVITTYNGDVFVGVVPQPVMPWLRIRPCGGTFSAGPTGFSRTLYAYTLETTSGYQLTSLLSDLNTALSGSLSLSLDSSNWISSGSIMAYSGSVATGASLGSASLTKPYGQIPLSQGEYAIQEILTLRAPVTSSITATGNLNYSFEGVIPSYNVQETLVVPSGNIFDLLNGVSSFPSSYAYQGDSNGNPSSSYPLYYSSSSAPSGYWGASSIDQPVYELVAAQSYRAGAVFWEESYGGNNVTIRMVATYGHGSSQTGDGIEVYMFLDPEGWAAISSYDDNIPYLASGTTGLNKVRSFSPVQGDVMLPTSYTNYLVLQWDPYWQTGRTAPNAKGQFNVWIVTSFYSSSNHFFCQVSPSPSPNLGNSWSGWDGVGTGYFTPSAKDYICFTITYDGSNNSIYGNALDLNTGQVATLSLSLGNAFTNPSSGSYIFGVGGSTGRSYNNWGFTLVNYASG